MKHWASDMGPSGWGLMTLLVAGALGSGCRERGAPRPLRASMPSAAPTVSAVSAADPCRKTALCQQFGRCSYRAVGASGLGSDWVVIEPQAKPADREYFSCVALLGSDCEASRIACQEHGECAAQSGRCVAVSDARCVASEACKRTGLCTAVAGWCQAGKSGSCERSQACRSNGACREVTVSVERIPDIYFASRKSLLSAFDATTGDLWAEPIPLVEPRSFAVENETAKILSCAALDSESCRASDECRTQGRCMALDGECQVKRP
ncbi:MAG TPA: hypothetical protein VFQ61_03665 [Polyangiaceae bacterium]|nr:hypothetical protein [Polyangiaceae bacterium]